MECQICFEHFDSSSFTPKVLIKCGHSFCKICLDRLISGKTYVTCPVCRENTKVVKLESLPTNYSLIQIIEKSNDMNTGRNILERYKYFDDKLYKSVIPVITRYNDPKKLNLKKIVNDDFVYVEEFENNQNFSIFTTNQRRNRRYNFNRNSFFGYLYNEFSYSIWMYRKGSKCRHSFSCLESVLKTIFYSACVSMLCKLPLEKILGFTFKDAINSESLNRFVLIGQYTIFALIAGPKALKCTLSLYIDEFLKIK